MDDHAPCYYRYYMNKITLKVARIGNSRGVRIPAETLERLGIGDSVTMEERADGILLRPIAGGPAKLSWAQTAAEMARSGEDWSDWDSLDDGLGSIPWNDAPSTRHVAERKAVYKTGKVAKKRTRK